MGQGWGPCCCCCRCYVSGQARHFAGGGCCFCPCLHPPAHTPLSRPDDPCAWLQLCTQHGRYGGEGQQQLQRVTSGIECMHHT